MEKTGLNPEPFVAYCQFHPDEEVNGKIKYAVKEKAEKFCSLMQEYYPEGRFWVVAL